MPSEKPTPGPWFLRHPEINDEKGVEIASVNCYRDCLPEEEANARLIAAAPDLLAACEQVLTDFGSKYPNKATYEQLKAALAKTLETTAPQG